MGKNIVWLLLAGALVLLQPACASTQEAVDHPVSSRLKSVGQTAFDNGAFAGLSLAVFKGERVLFAGTWGKANLEHDASVDENTIFYIGSITKPVTGLAVNLLIDEGKISLKDTVGMLLPGFEGPAQDVRIAQLLSQTSGIPDYVDGDVVSSFGAYSREDVLALFADKPLNFPPGQRWQYSNSNAYLLGLIIEAVSGKTYGEFIADRVAGPLGMTSTLFADESRIIPHRAAGYVMTASGPLNAPVYDPLLPYAAGSLLSTPYDIHRFVRAAYGDEKNELLPASVRQALLKPVLLPGRDDSAPEIESAYRLGSVVEVQFDGHRKVLHAGLTSGFTSHFAYYPDDDITVVVLANGSGVAPHPAHLEAELARIALGLPAPVTEPQVIESAFLDSFTGDYKFKPVLFFGTDVFGLSNRDGSLVFQFGPANAEIPAIPLVFIGNDRFISALDSEHVFSFHRDGSGAVDALELSFYSISFFGVRE